MVWAANYGALEWHAWTSRVEVPNQPTYALVDLDPGERTTWDEVLALARLHRTAFEHLGVEARPKLTGRRGIQIWVPIETGPSFDETREWVERVSRTVGAVVPDLVSWKWQVRERAGLARLDYTQNAINKTLVAPYSPRAARRRPGVRAHRLGRARRPEAAARPLHDPHHPAPAGRPRRPVRPGPHHPADACRPCTELEAYRPGLRGRPDQRTGRPPVTATRAPEM